MNVAECALFDRLESMPLEEARTAIHSLSLGFQIGSPNHDLCLSWLALKDAAEHSKQLKIEQTRHDDLLAEIKRPHWSVTPSFVLLVVSVLLSAAAIVVAYIALQEQRASSAANQPPHVPQPAVGTPSNLLSAPSSSTSTQPRKP